MRIKPFRIILAVALLIAILPILSNPLVHWGLVALVVLRIVFSVRKNNGWNVRSAKSRH